MVFDPTYPDTDIMTKFKECDWKAFYGDAKENVPPNASEPYGKEVDLQLFVDFDHADDQATRRPRTGFFVFLNMSAIVWFSKRQPTIESGVFGASKVNAMTNGMELLRCLWYKLRKNGDSFVGPVHDVRGQYVQNSHHPKDQNQH